LVRPLQKSDSRLEEGCHSSQGIHEGVVAVDADSHRDVGQPYGIQGFPTIKFFGLDKTKPSDYQGGRTAKDIVDFAVKEIQKIASQRLSGKAGSAGGNAGGRQRTESGSGSGSGSGPSAVVKLEASNFQELVLDSEEPWMVEFYAPWCGHCKSLAPAWEAASKKLKGKVNLGMVDATIESGLAQDFGVRGYPTIKIFEAGKKSKSAAKDYEGGRTADAIEAFAMKQLFTENLPTPEVVELVDQAAFDKTCGSGLCVVFVLPDILDSGASGRNTYLTMAKRVADSNKRKAFKYGWTYAMAHPDLESTLSVGGAGYPAVAVINAKKQRSSTLTKAVTEENLNKYLADLLSGKEATAPLSTTIKISSVPAWDGKDGVRANEDSFDLSELGLEFNTKENSEGNVYANKGEL